MFKFLTFVLHAVLDSKVEIIVEERLDRVSEKRKIVQDMKSSKKIFFKGNDDNYYITWHLCILHLGELD